ncbi:type I restriction endonuclease [Desulfogranum japonicum]|uniref:type I restriction endonuclease n=1 Tax=Desulfogranum japonicum TaxID=231447 RepID=UPI0003FE03BB|nr:type I restriction endonuclease [Desulfogranum japonicum]
MDFVDQLQALANRMEKQLCNISTEEATKNAFVMPFIQALGYDVFDPSEVVPELTADVGSKKGEKVDYAICIDGKPSMLFECKSCNANLDEVHAAQLRRYFHVTEARIGVLTNGRLYYFFSDLEEANIMDQKPFMEIDILNLDPQLLPELKKLTKSSFELDKMLTTANELKYVRAIKNILAEEMSEPTVEFVRFCVSQVYSGMKTQQVLDQFTVIVKKAFKQFVNDQVNDRLKSALGGNSKEESSVSDEAEDDNTEDTRNGIVTTEEELEGFYVVRAILREVVEIERIFHRDTKRYFGIILDDSNRKPICRLHLNTAQKYIGLFDDEKNETRHPIESLDDLYKFADEIKSRIVFYNEDA